MKNDTIVKKYKDVIYFEELPRNIQHALEILVEWHSVLVYKQPNGRYAFTVLDVYMPHGSDFTGLVKSKYVNEHFYIQKSIQKIIDTEYKGIKCAYFPKGNLDYEGKLSLSYMPVCEFQAGYGFSIEIHSNDYGFLVGEESRIVPAHAHVLDKDGLEIGLLNITGDCPRKVSDIKEFRPPYKEGNIKPIKETPLKKHRQNIKRWANYPIDNPELKNLWGLSQEYWKLLHEESPRR